MRPLYFVEVMGGVGKMLAGSGDLLYSCFQKSDSLE